ncbi:hypothetical protein [Mongoliitalea daihaiensis]|uniref:hypothetical protein n=1 Tax=Mongoliitalea daihaiensis TaxID=2782006 RepID=UPI001F440BE2|nr:hypothetical protein [Mongoliitalea daihaiensis]UJP65476.1 hypothetical protein IPZ59_02290 [Mongoliitalea daihaiensis]
MRIIKFISLSLFFAGLLYGGFYVYQELVGKKDADGLQLISADAIFVLETQKGDEFWQNLTSQPFWFNLQEIPSISAADAQVSAFSSLLEGFQSFPDLLRGKKMTVSLHPVGKDDFDLLFTLHLKKANEKDFLNYLEANLPELSQINERMYSGVTIKEFQSLNLDRNFSFTWVGDVLVGSFTSFLVEEAIRHSQNNSLSSFKMVYKPLFQTKVDHDGLGILRISSHGFARLIEGLSKNQSQPLDQLFSKNILMGNYAIDFEEGEIVLIGKTLFPDTSVIPEVSSEKFEVDQFVSNRVASWVSFNLNTVTNLNFFENQGFVEKNTVKGDIEKKLFENGFMDQLEGQLLLLNFEKVGNNPLDKVLLVKTKEQAKQIDLLKSFNPALGQSNPSLGSVDFFEGKEIFVLAVEEFPGHLFGGKYLGFPDTYVTSLDGFLVFANSSKALKLFLNDFSSTNVSRQVYYRNPEQVIQYYLDIPLSWSTLIDISAPSWTPFFQKYTKNLQSFQSLNISFQDFSSNQFNTTIRLGHQAAVAKSEVRQDVFLTETKSLTLPATLIYGPKRILNFNDKSPEFVIQDENYTMYLVTKDMEQVFSKNLEGPIVSEIYQVDYLKNGKLQMIFATNNQIHIVDRLGNYLAGFPVRPVQEPITHLNLVDYNNDRDYRYFIGTSEGNLWLLDRVGKPLDGWNPKEISAEPVVPPAHRRIAGVGDRMIALSKRGELYFFNRRGEPEVGSPFRLGDALHADYAIIERGNAKDTRLVTVTSGGEVVQVNFNGELTYRNQLEKEDRDTRFMLVKDQKEDRYLIATHSYNRVTFYDESYQLLFYKEVVSEQIELQLFIFGGDKSLIGLLDKEQEFLYLYNLQGDLLNAMPISAAEKMELVYAGSQNEYLIYTISGNKLAEYRLPF